MPKKAVWIVIIVLIVAAGAWFIFGRSGNDKTQYFTAAVGKGDIRAQVEATGTINAVTTVQVGSQVSGTISRLNADFNTKVKKGQVVALIDDSLFRGNLESANADLANSKANLAASRANLEKAKASAIQAKADFDRTAPLTKEGVMSQQQLDLARANADSATAAVAAAEAAVTQASASVQQKQAAVDVAQTNLDHTIISAPIDGTVINRSVDVGQTVAASLQAPTLFTIAQDLTKMQVYAKTDESDVGRIRAGQPVTFKVDAFPNETFRGLVHEVRMNATVVQNVVTYDTIIDFDNLDLKLFPGMTAYVTIPVAQAVDVLKIPNGALRYKPDYSQSELRAIYQKYGIHIGGRNGNGENASAAPASGSPAPSLADNGTVLAAEKASESGRAKGDWSKNGGNWAKGGGRPGMQGKSKGEMSPQGGAPQASAPVPAAPVSDTTRMAIVWKLLPDKSIQPVQVRVGITDFTVTELVSGDLKDGDELVTGSTSARASGPPRMGGPGVRR